MTNLEKEKNLQKIFEKSTYTWVLPNFNQLKAEYKVGSKLVSPIFPQAKRRYKWELRLYPNGNRNPNNVDLYLAYSSTEISDAVFAKYTLLLQNSNDEILVQKDSEAVFEDNWGYSKFISHEELMPSIPDDIIKIRVVVLAEVLTLQSYHIFHPPAKLWRDLGALCGSNKFSDFTFKFDDKSEIFVHRAIISAQSPVFRAMFTHDTTENNLGYTVITDIHKDTMSTLLDFIYTGNLKKLSVENTGKLLIAADKYELLDLKQLCTENLAEELKVSNALDVLLFADLHHVPEIKLLAFNYILENACAFSDPIKFEEVKKFPDLLVELVTKCLNRQ